jgi:uncharacterized protein YyaL (SSP411 family)
MKRRRSTASGTVVLLLLLGVTCRTPSRPAERNTLADESSLYLQSHADNPVHWHGWATKWFEQAARQKKLVLISIGYSACHWCHVMERETFADTAAARLMNEHFVNLKVDRDARPDLDLFYLNAMRLMNGTGGWPLNVIALPNGKPVFASTYLGKGEWMKALRQLSAWYAQDPAKMHEYADLVAKGVGDLSAHVPAESNTSAKSELLAAMRTWRETLDGEENGDEKFIQPVNLAALLAYGYQAGDPALRRHVERTLDRVARGGINDPVDGGVFRYATDRHWYLPHFEKLLADNALLLGLYATAFKDTRNPAYRDRANALARFLDRRLKLSSGGYAASLDAEAGGREGGYYAISTADLRRLFGRDFESFQQWCALVPVPGATDGGHILRQQRTIPELATALNVSATQAAQLADGWRQQLQRYRATQPAPRRDPKVVVGWNALLVGAWLEAHEAFGEAWYCQRAVALQGYLRRTCWEGGLYRHSPDATGPLFLDDQAAMLAATLRLYETTGAPGYLTESNELARHLLNRFADDATGLFRFSTDTTGLLRTLVRTEDDVTPSANATLARCLDRLGLYTDQPPLRARSAAMVRVVAGKVLESPGSHAGWLGLLTGGVYPGFEIVVTGPEAPLYRRALAGRFLPGSVVLAQSNPSRDALFQNRFSPTQTRVFVCRDNTCQRPVKTVAEAIQLLDEQVTWVER